MTESPIAANPLDRLLADAEICLEGGEPTAAAEMLARAGRLLDQTPVAERSSGARRLLEAVRKTLLRCERDRDRMTAELTGLRQQEMFRRQSGLETVNGVWFTGSA
jgi:hypothetical protein